MSGDGSTTCARLIKAQNKILRSKREHTDARYFLSCENCGGVILNVNGGVGAWNGGVRSRETRPRLEKKPSLPIPKKRKDEVKKHFGDDVLSLFLSFYFSLSISTLPCLSLMSTCPPVRRPCDVPCAKNPYKSSNPCVSGSAARSVGRQRRER